MERKNSVGWLRFIFVTIIVGVVFMTTAQPDLEAKIDAYIQNVMKEQNVPGLSLAVVKQGEIIYAKGYGFANLEHQVPAKSETVFQLASVAKQFTATGVMLLAQEGKLKVDDSITKYFPDAPKEWQSMTIRHLLVHTSGIAGYPSDFDYRKDYSEDDFLDIMFKAPLLTKPGQTWAYSDMGYVLLGILIHKVSGQFYGDYLQEKVFKPLGMSATQVIDEAAIIPNRAAGYQMPDGKLQNQGWVAPSLNTTADGALYTTVLDMAKWDAALYTEKILPQKALEEMWTPTTLEDGSSQGYGFGWGIGNTEGHRFVGHGGNWQGFTSAIVRYLDDELSVILLDNINTINAEELAHAVAAFYLE